jgi:hypothetical protein
MFQTVTAHKPVIVQRNKLPSFGENSAQPAALPKNISIATQPMTPTNVAQESGKNGIPAIASLILPGTGQMLNGEMSKGVVLLVGGLILRSFFGLGFLALRLYTMFDAYNHKSPQQ